MKALILFLFIGTCCSAQSYQIKMTQMPVADPTPLLKVYNHQTEDDLSPPPQTYITPVPVHSTHRVVGYMQSSVGLEPVSLILELSKDFLGKEIVKVTEYKVANSEYWQKLYFPSTASPYAGTGVTQAYNYKVAVSSSYVYFSF